MLSWTNPDYEYSKGVIILRRTDTYSVDPVQEAGYIIAEITDISTTYIDKDVEPATAYYYTLFTEDDLGNYSDPSITLFVTSASLKPINQMTVPELQTEISRLISVINQLQSQVSQAPSLDVSKTETIPTNYKFSAQLKYGQTSDDIKYLQIFLKSQGNDIYPEGLVTGNFGLSTQKAVTRFQEMYKSEILTPAGFSKGTGIIGTRTINKINQILGK